MRHTATAIEDVPDCPNCARELNIKGYYKQDAKIKYWKGVCSGCGYETTYDKDPVKRSVIYG